MERYNCTCHCGGSMFYKHLHDPSCDLFMHGEEAPQSEEAQLQAALDAEREKVKELEEWQRVVVGTGTDQEAVVRMAATEYTKTAVQCWKDENAKLTAQLATLQAQLRKPILVCQRCGRVSQDGWVPSRYECDALNGSLQCPDCQCIDLETNTAKELASICTQTQAQLARWKEALGEWLWNCTNLLGDYHIKTVQDFNEEVNRRIAWLMQHLDHTLPPPMTDEERDRMRKLSEDNAALQADNECKDSLIETLQAQLVAEQQRADRAVKDRSDVLDVKTKEGLSCSEWLMRTAIAERKAKDLESQLRHVEHDAETYRKMHAVCTMNLALANNDLTALRAENARLKAAICDIWNGHGLCEDHGQLGYWKLGKYIDLAIALQPERGTP